jgi:uncharacterized membrane protein
MEDREVAGPAAGTPAVRSHRDLDLVVSRTLVASLALGLALLIAGVALALLGRGEIPSGIDGLRAALRSAGDLQAEGFCVLGILVVILTPFVRVAGSVVVFAEERDWRFVLVTVTVLAIMMVTVWLGVA